MTRLDAVQAPGGDGGPGYFSDDWWSALRAVLSVLNRWHPKAQFTCSANSFNSTSVQRRRGGSWPQFPSPKPPGGYAYSFYGASSFCGICKPRGLCHSR